MTLENNHFENNQPFYLTFTISMPSGVFYRVDIPFTGMIRLDPMQPGLKKVVDAIQELLIEQISY